ncbi:MAG: 6-carboxytetrahydropterin synthase QueD [Dehalococcoidia bacterium]|nr:6-carboxytetrahydropterin synthase QueD [Dehalococcoidia bacterium]
MYRISVRQHFDAAHHLRNYRGKCEQMHGHRFLVVVTVEGLELNELGMVFDFSELKKHLQSIVDRFDHVCLNDIAPFDQVNPSAENIALVIYQELSPRLKAERISITSVEVWESPDSCATYIP